MNQDGNGRKRGVSSFVIVQTVAGVVLLGGGLLVFADARDVYLIKSFILSLCGLSP